MSQESFEASRETCGWNEAEGSVGIGRGCDGQDGVGEGLHDEEVVVKEEQGGKGMDIDVKIEKVARGNELGQEEGEDIERRWAPELRCVRCMDKNVECTGRPGQRCNRCKHDKKGCMHSKKVEKFSIDLGADPRCARCIENNFAECIGLPGRPCSQCKYNKKECSRNVEKFEGPPMTLSDVRPPRFHRTLQKPTPTPTWMSDIRPRHSRAPSDNANTLHLKVQKLCAALVDVSNQVLLIENLILQCADSRCDRCIAKNFADCVGTPGHRCRRCQHDKKGCSKKGLLVGKWNEAAVLSSDVRPPRFHRALHQPTSRATATIPSRASCNSMETMRLAVQRFDAAFMDLIDCIDIMDMPAYAAQRDVVDTISRIVAFRQWLRSA